MLVLVDELDEKEDELILELVNEEDEEEMLEALEALDEGDTIGERILLTALPASLIRLPISLITLCGGLSVGGGGGGVSFGVRAVDVSVGPPKPRRLLIRPLLSISFMPSACIRIRFVFRCQGRKECGC